MIPITDERFLLEEGQTWHSCCYEFAEAAFRQAWNLLFSLLPEKSMRVSRMWQAPQDNHAQKWPIRIRVQTNEIRRLGVS